ncbi:methyl-accepting chemotaxis protein [Oleiharenicola sp. Vm1]|uniref:methyl-accepting chemotaxis protein n=1 Tax=Oleiharenicola sp. Vm1 TaxID=3398393 RepID=UPI0039F64014
MKTKLKLRTMLLLSFSTVAAIALIIGSVGYYGADRNERAMHETGSVRLPGVDSLLLTKSYLERIRGVVEALARADISPEIRRGYQEELAGLREKYGAALKTYQALPKSPEESALAEQFLAALATWRGENNKALEYARDFENLGVANPEGLARILEQLTKDHYVVVQKVLLLLREKGHTFSGGDDPTLCNAGKWLPTFRSNNVALTAAARDIAEAHRRFHLAIGKIKGLVAEDKTAAADEVYRQEMTPAMTEVFKHFETMRGVVTEALALHERAETHVDGPVRRAQEITIAAADKLVQFNRAAAAGMIRDSDLQGIFIKRFSLGAMVVGTVLAMTLGLLVTRAIARPIQRVTAQLTAGAAQTAAAAAQVSTSSQSLASGASEQAASLEETGASLEELASMTKRNADSAASAKCLSGETRAAAEAGHTDMSEMRAAMNAIKTSSSDIAKIIKTIDEIAFQTNVLALNAAVEAARAGEAGAGFAVVAEEVRALAQRSAHSAKETASKIEVAIQNGEHGVRISGKVASSLDVIVAKARQVDDLVGQIASASSEQTQGIGQINAAVGQMDRVTQANAANAEETAAAAEELTAQSVTLTETVEDLHLLIDGGQRSQVPSSTARAAGPKHLPRDAKPAPARAPQPTALAADTSKGLPKDA